MGWFGSSVSGKEIDQVVYSHMERYLGAPKEFGQQGYDEKFNNMLTSLDEWATGLKLGDWKRSSIMGSLEAVLRNTYSGHIPSQKISQYVKLAQKIIVK